MVKGGLLQVAQVCKRYNVQNEGTRWPSVGGPGIQEVQFIKKVIKGGLLQVVQVNERCNVKIRVHCGLL